MTRSIGDRFGPRGCLHLPEITSLVIPSNTHVRFVLASDGMWDVIDNHTVRRMGLYYKYNSADALATALARKVCNLCWKLCLVTKTALMTIGTSQTHQAPLAP